MLFDGKINLCLCLRMLSAVCSKVQHSQFSKGAKPHLCMNKWNCLTPVLHVIELDPSCLGKAHSNKSGTSPGYANMELEYILAVLCVPSIACLLRSMDPKFGKVV